jgi:RNA-directed DNA polymerase
VNIPKPGQPGKTRPLSIPCVRDRVAMAAAKSILEPIFEADFLPCSFGFRPKRSAHQALEVVSPLSTRERPGRSTPTSRTASAASRSTPS